MSTQHDTQARAPISAFTEYVLPDLDRWTRDGAHAALITLIGIEGGAPRPIGAQMAVAEDGRASGHISGGCLEGALIAEARAAMAEGRNRLVRYGKGSPYIDVRLPCGSGLDLYIDQFSPARFAADMAQRWADRQPLAHVTDLDAGVSTIRAAEAGERSRLEGRLFTRVHAPRPRLMLVGAGAAAGHLSALADSMGWHVDLVTPNAGEIGLCGDAHGVRVRELHGEALAAAVAGDAFTAGAVVFHDHEWELPVIAAMLRTECFYIGAVGSRRVHELRLDALRGMGFGSDALRRIRGPAGLIGATKSPPTLALSVMAEIAAAARDSDIIA
ncbi:MAG: XdhC family protein [Hyphomicrobiales bacterium]|nr:XdhC family protein [Hyphomicrobiales bacterium]